MPSISNYVHSLASYTAWYARTLLSEVRTVPHRIRMLPRKKNDPIDLGPLYEESPSGELVPCKATIARTQYVEFLLARYPWASDADILLALDGWDKGTELVRHTLDTSKMDASAAKDQYPLALSHQ
jgi:hypothetical protein